MRTLARLKKIRLVQEQAAEHDLLAARFALSTAVRRLAELEQMEAVARNRMVQGVITGDAERAHLGQLEQARARSWRPYLQQDASQRAAECCKLEESYFSARRDRSVVDRLLRDERDRIKAETESKEQKLQDEQFLAQRRKASWADSWMRCLLEDNVGKPK